MGRYQVRFKGAVVKGVAKKAGKPSKPMMDDEEEMDDMMEEEPKSKGTPEKEVVAFVLGQKPAKKSKKEIGEKGNAKSGNYGHRGIPGHRGGSAPKGGAVTGTGAATTAKTSEQLAAEKRLKVAAAGGNPYDKGGPEGGKPYAKPAATPTKPINYNKRGVDVGGGAYTIGGKPKGTTVPKGGGIPVAKPVSSTPKLKWDVNGDKTFQSTSVNVPGRGTFEASIQRMNFSDPKAKYSIYVTAGGKRRDEMLTYYPSIKAATDEVNGLLEQFMKHG